MFSKFSLNMPKIKPPKKVEVFNFRNKVNQQKFNVVTSNCPSLSDVFDTEENLNMFNFQFLDPLS